MKTYQVTVSPLALDHKPDTEEELENIQNAFMGTGMTFNHLVVYSVAPYSYTVAPAVFKYDYRNKKNWRSQEVYYLDFDNTLTIEQVLDRFKEYDITPNFYYTTFRHTESAPRFRVVLLTDFRICDEKSGDKLRNGLSKVFPEADQTCFTAERMFFGGKECFPLTEEPIPFSKLEQMISLHVLEADNGKSRGLMSENGYPYCNYYSDTRIETMGFTSYRDYLDSLKENKFDFDELYSKVRVYREFVDGHKLLHPQLFGIATNLIWLKGGAKRFNDTIASHNASGKTNYAKEKLKMMTYLKNRTYNPMNLKNFSPYPEDWEYLNLITAVRLPKKMVEVVKEQNLISLEEAEDRFEVEMERLMNSKDSQIYLVKLPPGFGKTTYLTQQKGHVLAFPTHQLKADTSERMKVPNHVTSDIPTFENPEVNRKIKGYYDMGLNEAARKVLESIASGSDLTRTYHEDQKKAVLYLANIGKKFENDITVLTTHQRALMNPPGHHTLIFDEDPIKDILSTNTVLLTDLIITNSNLPEDSRFDKTLSLIQNTKPGIVTPISFPSIERDWLCNTLAKNPVGSNVGLFLSASCFIKNKKDENKIHYLVKRDLPDDKKIVIMSATAQEHLYEKLYPGRVEVLDLTNIETVGKVYQHLEMSCSRASLTDSNIHQLNDELAYVPLITFKSKKHLFNSPSSHMHYGNLLGYNDYEGSDIIVVGTPHYNDVVYRLFAYAAGIDPNGDQELKTRQVEYGNYRFCFTTFASKEMQQIQLGLIESELIQAVGRARVLRNDCIVELYSNLPLAYAVLAKA